MTSQDDNRLRTLEARLTHVEDMLAIYQLLAAYGLAVDRGDADAATEPWLENSTYDWGAGIVEGVAGMRAMVASESHQSMIAGGAGHVLSHPYVAINGDRATAFCYTRLYRRDGDRFVLARLSANRWELVRTPEGWRVQSRTNRTLDGSPAARALLNPAKA